jgi:hypothetical protein
LKFWELIIKKLKIEARVISQYDNQWWYPYGIDYHGNSKRVSKFKEGIEHLKMTFGEDFSSSFSSIISSTINFDGNYFKINRVDFKKSPKKSKNNCCKKNMVRLQSFLQIYGKISFLSLNQFLLSKEIFEKFLSSVKNTENKCSIAKNSDVLKSIELDVLIAETESELKY